MFFKIETYLHFKKIPVDTTYDPTNSIWIALFSISLPLCSPIANNPKIAINLPNFSWDVHFLQNFKHLHNFQIRVETKIEIPFVAVVFFHIEIDYSDRLFALCSIQMTFWLYFDCMFTWSSVRCVRWHRCVCMCAYVHIVAYSGLLTATNGKNLMQIQWNS